MAKYLGYSALSSWLRYIRDNSDVMYLASGAGHAYATLTGANGYIVSANVSAADFSIASANAGSVLTIGAKNSQPVEGSGLANHLYLVTTSGSRIVFVTTVSAQVLASGNTVNIGSTTVTANASASNS